MRAVDDPAGSSWYSVRCVFHTPSDDPDSRDHFEERITLWLADSFDHAIERAEEEAGEYAAGLTCTHYCGLEQAYRLVTSTQPGDGDEVFSMLRDSELAPHAYLKRYFETGGEHQQ